MTATTPSPATKTRLSDASLMRSAAEGDEDAFRFVFERHVDAIRAYLIARVGFDAGDDLLAETFAAAWVSRRNFRLEVESARPWLYGIATMLVRRYGMRERRWQEALAREKHTVVEPIESGVDDALVSRQLQVAISRLSFREREILLLVALGDLSVAGAARVVGISGVAARTRLRRARRNVITELRRMEAEPNE